MHWIEVLVEGELAFLGAILHSDPGIDWSGRVELLEDNVAYTEPPPCLAVPTVSGKAS